MIDIELKLKNCGTEEGKKYLRDFIEKAEIGTLYYKCIISPYDLGWNTEYWGHCFSDLKTAKKEFKHDVDEDLDGDLDYGFMTIMVFEVQLDENGKHIGKNTKKRFVNNFGHWQDEETFVEKRFGFTHQDYVEMVEKRFFK